MQISKDELIDLMNWFYTEKSDEEEQIKFFRDIKDTWYNKYMELKKETENEKIL